MKHLIIVGAAAVMAVAAAGCSGSEVSHGPASYLAVGGSKVAFIQWRSASGGRLRGTITESSVGGSGPAQTLSVAGAPFTGTMTGGSVRLTFAVPYFLRAHALGTLSGGALRLAVPQSDGTVKKVTFSQADEVDYHHAIAALRTRISRRVAMAVKQQASQRQPPARAQAEQSTQRTLNALYRESSIAHGSRLTDGLAQLADDVAVARSHLATEKRDGSGDNKYCGAAFTVTGDAQAVGGALQKAQGAVMSLMPDISAVRHDAASASASLRHLSRSGIPAPSQAPNVIANANASLKQAIATANSYIGQVNAIDARARVLADNMATRSCSSARSGSSPQPIPPIGPAGGKPG